jgi:predicted DsbA family dithiol-disulfide isomerase
VISHRHAARRAAPDLPFAIPALGQPYPSSSFPAQILMTHVKTAAPGKLDALEEEIFRASFERLEDIGDPAVLLRAAEAVGLPAGDVDRALDDRALRTQVIAEHREGESRGVQGIPAVVVPGVEPITGAVPVEVYRAALLGLG